MAAERVGVVQRIARYPVKSMAGEFLEEAYVTLQGILGDRWYAFVQARAGDLFPWLTAREVPLLLAYQARLVEGRPPSAEVRTPEGRTFAPGDPELLAELEARFGSPAYFLPNYRGSFDVAAISLITTPTIARLSEAAGTDAAEDRFRMTLVVDRDGEPFAEDGWVGRTVRVGDAMRVAVTERDKRCLMTNLDPTGGPSNPAMLRSIAELNGAFAGVYASVVTAGRIAVGDPVWLE